MTSIPTVETAAFEIRGSTVYTHQPDAVLIYTRRVEDPTQFDPLFVEALSYKLAAELVLAVEADTTLRRLMTQDYQLVMAQAAGADARDGTVRADRDADWIRARG